VSLFPAYRIGCSIGINWDGSVLAASLDAIGWRVSDGRVPSLVDFRLPPLVAMSMDLVDRRDCPVMDVGSELRKGQ
jgi:hypothetical protein